MDALGFVLLCIICAVIGRAIRALAADRSMLAEVLRYQAPGWPSGVQEDDDLHWRWRGAPVSGTLTTERLRAHVAAAGPIETLRRRRR